MRTLGWDFPWAGSQPQSLLSALGNVSFPGGWLSLNLRLSRAASLCCCIRGPRSPGWGFQGNLAAPEHLIPTNICRRVGRSWLSSTGCSRGFGVTFGKGKKRGIILFSISRCFHGGGNCAGRSFSFHSPIPAGSAPLGL